MNRNCFSCIFLLIATFLLTACSSSLYQHPVSPLQRNRVCEDLKEQIIQNSVRNVPDEQGYMPTELARLYRDYERNNCDAKLGVTQPAF